MSTRPDLSGTAPMEDSPRLRALFRAVVAMRWWFVALYALLCPLGVWMARQVGTDNAIARLVVATDADYRANEAFQRIFPEGEQVILLATAPDPFDPAVVERVARLESALSAVPRVGVFSALDLHARAPAAGDFRRFVTASHLFR